MQVGVITSPTSAILRGSPDTDGPREHVRTYIVWIPADVSLSCRRPCAVHATRVVIFVMIELAVGTRRERVTAPLHVCQFASAPDERTATASTFLFDGLRAGHRCIPLVGEPVLEAVRLACTEEVDGYPPFHLGQWDAVVPSGGCSGYHDKQSLTPTDPSAMDATPDASQFFTGNSLDPYRLIAYQRSIAAEARRAGGKMVRMVIDMRWLFHDRPFSVYDALKFEASSHAILAPDADVLATLTQYHYADLSAAFIIELLKIHPVAVVAQFVRRNPHPFDAHRYMTRILERQK